MLQRHSLIILLLLLIVSFAAVLRVSVLDFPLERDEGDYAYNAQPLLEGTPLSDELVRIRFPAIL